MKVDTTRPPKLFREDNNSIQVIEIDSEYYVIDSSKETHEDYIGMCVYMNGDGKGRLNAWVAPFEFASAGAKYVIVGASKKLFLEPIPVIDKRIFDLLCERYFTSEQIAIIQESAYEHGYNAGLTP